jgi:hypothetical protein
MFALFSGCQSTKTEVLPLPKYADLMVQVGTFKGIKSDLEDSFNSRDVNATITAKNDSVVIFTDGTTKFEVTLFSPKTNLTLLTVKQQVPNIVGRRDANSSDVRDHGFFMPKDASGNSVNRLVIQVNIGTTKWLYDVQK